MGVSNIDSRRNGDRVLSRRSRHAGVSARGTAGMDTRESAWHHLLECRTQVWQAGNDDTCTHLGERPEQVGAYAIGQIATKRHVCDGSNTKSANDNRPGSCQSCRQTKHM